MNEHVQFNTWRLILLGESASEFHWCWYSLCVVLFQSPDCFLFFGANASRVSSFECSKDRISNSHLILHSFPVFYFVSVAAVYNSSSCILPFFAGKCCMLNKIFYKIFFDEWWHGHWRRFLLSLEIEFLGNVFIHEILLKVWFSFSLSVDNCIILICCFGETLWGFLFNSFGVWKFLWGLVFLHPN